MTLSSPELAASRTVECEYALDVRQQPKQARMAGNGERADRRPIDPPPIIRLRIRRPPSGSPGKAARRNPAGSADTDFMAPTLTHSLFMFASLVPEDSEEEQYLLSGSRTKHVTGSVVSSLFHLKDQSCFVFPDLSVRTEGRWRFKMSLYEILEDGVHYCASIITDTFQVYSSKRFPGMGQSTDVSRAFASQGLRLRIRRPVSDGTHSKASELATTGNHPSASHLRQNSWPIQPPSSSRKALTSGLGSSLKRPWPADEPPSPRRSLFNHDEDRRPTASPSSRSGTFGREEDVRSTEPPSSKRSAFNSVRTGPAPTPGSAGWAPPPPPGQYSARYQLPALSTPAASASGLTRSRRSVPSYFPPYRPPGSGYNPPHANGANTPYHMLAPIHGRSTDRPSAASSHEAVPSPPDSFDGPVLAPIRHERGLSDTSQLSSSTSSQAGIDLSRSAHGSGGSTYGTTYIGGTTFLPTPSLSPEHLLQRQRLAQSTSPILSWPRHQAIESSIRTRQDDDEEMPDATMEDLLHKPAGSLARLLGKPATSAKEMDSPESFFVNAQ